MTKTLLKALKLNQNKSLSNVIQFVRQTFIENDQIIVVIALKTKAVNPTTKQLEEKTVENSELNLLTKHSGFVDARIDEETYTAIFNHPEINLLKSVINNYDELTNAISLPFHDDALAQKRQTIETIINQIKQSREQADQWEEELETTHKKELKDMKDANQEMIELSKEARKKGLI